MPTTPIADTIPDWGSAGNYPASIYPLKLPWLNTPNPVGGLPTPWSGQPRLDATAFTSFVNNGHSPQIPTNASQVNEWQRRLGAWANWVILGTSAADADAHIMETNGAGLCSAQGFESTTGYSGAGGTPATLPNGAGISAGKLLTLGAGPTPAAAGQMTRDAAGLLLWYSDHLECPGLRRSRHLTNTTAAALSDNSLATTRRVTAPVNLLVTATVEVQRIAAGNGQIKIEQDNGAGIYGILGAARVDKMLTQVDPNAWTTLHITRLRTADSTARLYRLDVSGLGSNVVVRERTITVAPAE